MNNPQSSNTPPATLFFPARQLYMLLCRRLYDPRVVRQAEYVMTPELALFVIFPPSSPGNRKESASHPSGLADM